MRHDSPGVFITKPPAPPPRIEGVALTLAAFIGVTAGEQHPDLVRSTEEFAHHWPGDTALATAVEQFFANGGTRAWVVPLRTMTEKSVRRAVEDLDPDVALVAIPDEPVAPPAIVAAAQAALGDRGALLLLDGDWPDVSEAVTAMADPVGAVGASGGDCVVYWPRLSRPLPGGGSEDISPLGAVAGIIAHCEDVHGVDKTPAGVTARIAGVTGPAVSVDDLEMNPLNDKRINVIRQFPGLGTVVWGARTLSSDPEWKYVPVRRMAVFLERSLRRGLQWAVFEPNGEPLWERVRMSIEDFLQDMFRGGMLGGPRPDSSYFIRCDRSTMTQDDIDNGRLIIEVGFAPLRPAEFIVLRIRLDVAGG
ncbi:hypothetical protein GCM10017607_03190 [Microbacterium thalassium]|nr:hypothetical protein GCM10017607_03190 [Microbacterium thalassium]